MKDKLPPKTGLDFGAMMDEIDDQEELKKESENVKELLGQVQKVASELEASFETMVIEAFGMDETAASIQEASWKIKWTLDRIDLALERMNETKYTVQKLALEEYKLEQKELFAKFRNDLQSVIQEPGVWLSFKAWMWALVIALAVLALFFGFGFFYAKSKFT